MRNDRRRRARELALAYRETGARRYRNDLVELHLDVADAIVRRYSRSGVPVEDLRQVALLAMIRCADRFDVHQGVEFATFANTTVDGEIKRYFRDRTWAVRPPRYAQELHLRLRRAEDELTQQLGRPPTIDELAADLDESVDTILDIQEIGRSYRAASLDSPVRTSSADEDLVLADAVLGRHERGFDLIEVRDTITRLVNDLDDADRLILRLRYVENHTQEDIARVIGISQSYLSRMLHRILDSLRAELEAADESAPTTSAARRSGVPA
jgi:RNA polymerase sigma-B factor